MVQSVQKVKNSHPGNKYPVKILGCVCSSVISTRRYPNIQTHKKNIFRASAVIFIRFTRIDTWYKKRSMATTTAVHYSIDGDVGHIIRKEITYVGDAMLPCDRFVTARTVVRIYVRMLSLGLKMRRDLDGSSSTVRVFFPIHKILAKILQAGWGGPLFGFASHSRCCCIPSCSVQSAEHAPGNGKQVNKERQVAHEHDTVRIEELDRTCLGLPVSQVEDPCKARIVISPRGSIISSHTLVVSHNVAPARRRRRPR